MLSMSLLNVSYSLRSELSRSPCQYFSFVLTQSHFWRSYLALVVSSTILLPQCFTVLVLVVSFSYLVRLFFLLVWVFSRFWGLMVVCVKV